MPLSVGDKLGPYQIVAAIGKGGMGEVYRAYDPRTDRQVAIKISAEQFSERFSREVRAIAALNHPNICTLYDVGPNYLVMELVEGQTLATRIKQGALPLNEALAVARQIADALEAAHEKGVTHRDLKPGNVIVKEDGAVKVLDFGLAKVASAAPASGGDPELSPTISMHATQLGVVLGTAAYMAPEQARGKPVDKRADIWAFGVVLYEMLTGKRLFQGEDLTETLASVVKEEPSLDKAPIEVRRLLRKCLQKDPKKRLRDIGDAWELLEAEHAPAIVPSGRRSARMAWITAAILAVALGAVSLLHFRAQPHPAQLQRFAIPSPDPVPGVARLSPDGTRLLLLGAAGSRKLWLRRMDSLETRPIEGTEGALGVPFWSPDSRSVVFAAAGKLKKIDVEGGAPQVLCDGPLVIGGFWTPDGRIAFSDPSRQPGLFQVPASGGTASPLPGFDQHPSDRQMGFPVLLPDGKHFVYIEVSNAGQADLYLAALDPKSGQSPRKLLSEAGIGVAFAPAEGDRGYLLFVRSGGLGSFAGPLMAQPFDLGKLELTGEPIPVAPEVAAGSFSASLTGALAYLPGVSGSLNARVQLTCSTAKAG
jgi:predicted Ser/Thr protein kinase